jgi:hypothetical protein
MKIYTLLLVVMTCGVFWGGNAKSQTGPSGPDVESLDIFAGSGRNHILIHSVDPGTAWVTVTSGDPQLLEVIEVDHIEGRTLAVVLVEEKGLPGTVTLEIDLDGAGRILEINIVNYENRGVNYEVHDIVFWQRINPMGELPVYDTILNIIRNPEHGHSNNGRVLPWDKIELTVDDECTAAVCGKVDFYTGLYHGFIVPPLSGEYVFFMNARDNAAMYLSSDDNHKNTALILHSDHQTLKRESAPQLLEAGKAYAFHAPQWIIHTPDGGIQWKGPHDDTFRYITDEFVMYAYDNIKPASPGNLDKIWLASSQAMVGWERPAESVRGYNLYLDGIRLNKSLVPATQSSFRLEDLNSDSPYSLVVTSVDVAGNESLVSNILSFRTYPEDNSPPSPPTTLDVIQATGLAARIAWSGATDEETEVIAYNLYVDGSLFNTGDYIYSGDNTIIIDGLLPNTAYSITIEALDAGFNVSPLSEVFPVTTTDYDPLGEEHLGIRNGRMVVHVKNIAWNEGIGVNGQYTNGSFVDDPRIRELLRELRPGALRWGAIDANDRSFSAHTGSVHDRNTYGRVMDFANEIGAWFALTIGVHTDTDYMKDPETFLRLIEYLNGPPDTPGGAIRAEEGFGEPLLAGSKGIIIEFGNEVWGGPGLHRAPIGSNYDNYGDWCRRMADVIRSSPWYDPEKILLAYSGRNPHPGDSYNLNNRVVTGDRDHVEVLAVSGYLGGNLNYSPEIPRGESELDYYKSGIAAAKRNIDGLKLTTNDLMARSGTVKKYYLYESNMTRPNYAGRFGQAILMTDYLAAGVRQGSMVPTIFHLTGGEWRITVPPDNYRPLPLFVTSAFFNRFCKGHDMKTEFISTSRIYNASGSVIDWEPVGAYAYNRGENFSIMLINRDFTAPFTVQVVLPDGLDFDSDARMYTIWEDDFSSTGHNIDSVDVVFESGMFVEVPKHAMVIIAARGDDPGFKKLPEGFFDRVLPDSIDVKTDGGTDGEGNITRAWGYVTITSEVFPTNAFNRGVVYEIIENTTERSAFNFLISSGRLRITAREDDHGIIRVRARAGDNPAIYKDLEINVDTRDIPSDTELIPEPGMRLFHPNPAGDFIYVSREICPDSRIEFFDLNGRKIMDFALNGRRELSLQDLDPGLYFIRVTGADGTVFNERIRKN